MTEPRNVDDNEVSRFDALAHRWWDPQGAFKPLHDINPIRAQFIDERLPLNGKRILDIGCGGGILTEEMSRRGAQVTGIDAGEAVINVARLHQIESKTAVTYLRQTAEEHLIDHREDYDVVTCLELLEHVPNPASLVEVCTQLTRPGGSVFFSTINRNIKSWLNAIVAAEDVFGILPRGTHDYAKFIKPSELSRWSRLAGLELKELIGMGYNPFTGSARLSCDVGINYLAWMNRP